MKNKIAYRKKIIEIDTKYQTEKKEQEIELLKAKGEIYEKQKIIYICLIFLMFMGLIFGYWTYKNKLKTSQKLKEINTLKSHFFANISHEFRTPLTLIKSPLQLLKSQSNTTQQPPLEMIERNANRMLE